MDNEIVKRKFGNRKLNDINSFDDFNAWDDVQLTEDQINESIKLIQMNSSIDIPISDKMNILKNSSLNWNEFYKKHEDRFFKDRHWLLTEIPALDQHLRDDKSKISILEVGCGVGNAIIPLLNLINLPSQHIYCCDFSPSAIEILQKNTKFDQKKCTAFVADLTDDNFIDVVLLNSNSTSTEGFDYITVVFVLSAIYPKYHQAIVDKLYKLLKIGGKLFFRDYAIFDMTQLRFKPGKCLENSLYFRGDNTMVYYFKQEEVASLFIKSGFKQVELRTDRRLLVNRAKQLKMYRQWIQGQFIK